MQINNYLTKTAIISAVSSLAMFGVACTGSPGYTGIQAPPLQIFVSRDGGTTYVTQSSQRIIDVYGSDDPASTPEPGTVLGLLAMGFVGGVSTLKNKNKG